MNVFGGDSDDVLDACQHFASNSGFAVKVQGIGIMCTLSSENVCEEQHTQVVGSCDAQVAYNTVQELSPAILENLAHCQSYKVICF